MHLEEGSQHCAKDGRHGLDRRHTTRRRGIAVPGSIGSLAFGPVDFEDSTVLTMPLSKGVDIVGGPNHLVVATQREVLVGNSVR